MHTKPHSSSLNNEKRLRSTNVPQPHKKRKIQKPTFFIDNNDKDVPLKVIRLITQMNYLRTLEDEVACIEVLFPLHMRLAKELCMCEKRNMDMIELFEILIHTGRLATLTLGWGGLQNLKPSEYASIRDMVCEYYFSESCSHGHLAVAKWLVKRFMLKDKEVRAKHYDALWGSCEHGHVHVAQWLVKNYGQVTKNPNIFGAYVLMESCKHGHLAVSQWIAECFKLKPKHVRYNDNSALRMSCEHGHIEVAQWLVEHFELTAKDARSKNNYALRWSCGNGHLEVAQWLVDHFKLTAEDARMENNFALWMSCSNGHIAVAHWLAEHLPSK